MVWFSSLVIPIGNSNVGIGTHAWLTSGSLGLELNLKLCVPSARLLSGLLAGREGRIGTNRSKLLSETGQRRTGARAHGRTTKLFEPAVNFPLSSFLLFPPPPSPPLEPTYIHVFQYKGFVPVPEKQLFPFMWTFRVSCPREAVPIVVFSASLDSCGKSCSPILPGRVLFPRIRSSQLR